MSFAVNLHDCFEMVHQHSIQRRKGANEFIQLMEEKALVEEHYAKGLERIGNNQVFVTTQGTLSHGILAMKNDALNRAMQAKILAENIVKDVAEPLKELLKTQARTLAKTHTEGKKSEKERQDLVEKHDKFKAKYMRACKEYETLTFQMDTPQINVRREKSLQRIVQVKQEIDESLKGYKESIVQHNLFKDKYTDFMSKILEVYQRQEEQRLELMKDCLRKLVIYETSYLRNLQYDIDNLARAMESINVKSDVKQFVDENSSTSPINLKLEFEPYQGQHELLKNLGRQAPAVKIAPAPMRLKFSELLNQSSIEEILKVEVDLIVNKCWENSPIAPGEFQYFESIAKEASGRKVFFWCITMKKSQKLTSLSESGYMDLCKLFNILLDECNEKHDTNALKNCILLIQVFHLENSPKKNLQEELKKNQVWTRLDYWESMIYIGINEEIAMQQQYVVDEEGKEEKGKRLKNIIFCQLGSFAHIMDGFEIEQKFIAEIILKYACRYELTSEDMETLMVIYR